MKRNRPLRFSVSIGVFSFTAAVSWLHAQPAANRVPPHIGFVYPAGGQRGTTFVVSVGGQNLVGASGVYFSVPGIAARIIDYERPLTQTSDHPLNVLMSLGSYGRRGAGPSALLSFVHRLIRFGADRDAAAVRSPS